MTKIPTSDDLAEIVQALVQLGVAEALSDVAGVSLGTIYRHARPRGAKGRPGRMDPDTFKALSDLFLELGLLDDQGYATMRAASDAIRERAAAISRREDEPVLRDRNRRARDLANQPGKGARKKGSG